ncbi:MAG TPA: bifunctional UDP-sugar hydrolase/5'-nucleotidase [Myxococcales bacterium]|nr:bifunctional UDP-sugar hydrolase/5'-nucleotidase [Myxococcales bacterium]
MPHRSCTLAVALLLCACSAPSSQRKHEAEADQRIRHLVIVGINDVHGALLASPAPRSLTAYTDQPVGGAEWFAGWVSAIRRDAQASDGEVLVIDAGDEFQGTLLSNQFEGRPVVDAFNEIGVAAAALGNHEFDFGLPVLLERMKQAHYPMLAANVFNKGTKERPEWARPSVLLEIGGVKVGIVGLVTVDTPTVTNPLIVAHLDFAPGGPIAAAEARALRARGATVVIVAAHAGPFPPEREIQHIAAAVHEQVDAIVSGHHHTNLGPPPLIVAGIPIVQAGTKLVAFSVVDLMLDAEGRMNGFAVNRDTYPKAGAPQPILHSYLGVTPRWRGQRVVPDARVASLLAGYDEKVQQLRETRIGSTQLDLRKGGEGLLGNLVADALRSGAGGALPAEFGLQNSGGLRVPEVPKGPITFGQIFDLYPFDNQQVVVAVPAVAIRNALETVLRAGKLPLQVSGLRYTIDWDRFADLGTDRRTWPSGALVTEMMDERGAVLCETRSCSPEQCEANCAAGTHTVSTSDFLANGGDGLAMLKDAPRQTGSVLTRDIVMAYVKLHDPITPELVGSGRPRITIKGMSLRAQAE